MAKDRGRLRQLPGSERPRPQHHQHVGPADPNKLIGVTILVRHRPGSPPLPDLQYWHTTPLRERRAMSRDDYAQIYGADENDLAAVSTLLPGHGLRTVESHAGRRSVTVEGTQVCLSSPPRMPPLTPADRPISRSRLEPNTATVATTSRSKWSRPIRQTPWRSPMQLGARSPSRLAPLTMSIAMRMDSSAVGATAYSTWRQTNSERQRTVSSRPNA